MAAQVRPNASEARDLAGAVKIGQLGVERKIGEAVGVICQEHVLVCQVLLDRLEPLADVRGGRGVDEGDAPSMDVAVQQFQLVATAGEDEVVGQTCVVGEERVVYGFRYVAEADSTVW